MKNKITLFWSNVFWALVVSLLFINDEIRANESIERFENNEKFSKAIIDDNIGLEVKKVTICHKLKIGNDWKFVTLSIPETALQAHLDHGDSLGSCEEKSGKPTVYDVIIAPPNAVVQCGGDYSSASTGVATLNKHFKCLCPGLRVEESDTEIFRSSTKIVISRKWTAMSNCGVEGFAFQKITILAPKELAWINEPMDKTIQCNGSDVLSEFSNWLNSFTGEGGCGDAVVTHNSNGLSQSCGNTGRETVTFTLTDDDGNTIQKNATFKVEDKTPPTWVVAPTDRSGSCDGNDPFAGPNVNPDSDFNLWLKSFSGTDSCGNALVANNADQLTNGKSVTGSLTVTFTLIDDCGNFIQKDATYTTSDNEDPKWINPPEDKTISCDISLNVDDVFQAWLTSFSGEDDCGDVVITNDSEGLSDLCGETGAETVTFTLSDEEGNSIQQEATFTVEDKTPPTWVNMPTDKTVECDGLDGAFVGSNSNPDSPFNLWLNSFSGTDNCGNVVVANNADQLTSGNEVTGSLTVTFTLIDDCGNSIQKDATFTVIDNTPPIWVNEPTNKTIECDLENIEDAFAAWLISFSGEDKCGDVTITNSSQGLSDLCGNTGTETVVFTLTDDSGNAIEKEATFTVEDKTAPTWTVEPTSKTIECNSTDDNENEFSLWLSSFSGTDSCGTATVTYISKGLSDLCGNTGSETVVFTLADECGNTIEKEATFTVEDKTAPTWAIEPIDKTIECRNTDDINTEFSQWLSSFSGTDSCGTATVTYISKGLSDLCGNTGSETVVFTLTDECGNSIEKEATFTVEDKTPPVWVVKPEDKVVECNGINDVDEELTNWLTEFSGEDSCGKATVIQKGANLVNLCGGTGVGTVTFILSDECGNFIEEKVTFTVVDNTPPTWVNMPEDKIVECSEGLDVNEELTTWLNSFSGEDSCGKAEITNNSSGLNISCGSSGSETVIFTLTDECGNSIEKEATFSVKDTTPPIINVPEDVTIECSEDYRSEITGIATGEDSCGNVVITESDTEESSCGNSKIVTRTWIATDACGNFVEGTQIITIKDTTKPVLSAMPENITVTCLSDVPGDQKITASDNCDDSVEVVFVQSELPTCGGEVVNTWEATDDCGNKITYSQTVFVEDSITPEFIGELPKDETVECDEIPDPVTLTVQDNCGGEVNVNFKEEITTNEGSCANSYLITRTWSVKDCSENLVEHIQVITVQDSKAPELIGLPESDLTVDCSNIPVKAEVTAEDNCSSNVAVEYTETTSETDDDGIYNIIRVWSASDECSNEISFTQTITVEPLDMVVLNTYEICVNDGFVDLSSLVSNEARNFGTWLDENNSGGLNGFIFDSSKVALGTYNFLLTYDGVNAASTCLPMYALTIEVHDRCVVKNCETASGIEVSKVVTPNADGYNDVFEISDVRSCGFTPEVQIFNRWGHMVYQSNDYYNNWDGLHNNSGMTIGSGSNLPSGTYYYIVNIVGSGYKPMTGYIYLGNN